MGAESQKQKAALTRVMQADREEAERGVYWGILALRDKRFALHLARIDTDRAAQPLSSFTPGEREQIHIALTGFLTRLGIIAKLTGVSMMPLPASATVH